MKVGLIKWCWNTSKFTTESHKMLQGDVGELCLRQLSHKSQLSMFTRYIEVIIQ